MKETNKRKSITIKLSEYEWNQLQAYMSRHLEITPKYLMMEALNNRLNESYRKWDDAGGY